MILFASDHSMGKLLSQRSQLDLFIKPKNWFFIYCFCVLPIQLPKFNGAYLDQNNRLEWEGNTLSLILKSQLVPLV